MPAIQTTPAYSPIQLVWSWTPLGIAGAVVIAFAVHAIVYGPAMHEKAEQLRTEQIDQENTMLCEKLGMALGSERFATCAGSLSEVRQRHAKRLAAEAAGIL